MDREGPFLGLQLEMHPIAHALAGSECLHADDLALDGLEGLGIVDDLPPKKSSA
jgi:hypothetical protein